MDGKSAAWEPLPVDGPEIEGDRDYASGAMALDLLQAIEQNRDPVCSARDGLWTIEMIAAIYRAQFSRARVSFPLQDRRDPFASA